MCSVGSCPITIAVRTAVVAAVINWRASGHSLSALPSHSPLRPHS